MWKQYNSLLRLLLVMQTCAQFAQFYDFKLFLYPHSLFLKLLPSLTDVLNTRLTFWGVGVFLDVQ